MTATADRFGPGSSREELRLAQVASGLLMLLDAHRLTGRLPLDVQVQTSRLRHAVKLAIHTEPARLPRLAPPPPAVAGLDPAAAALRAWIADQPWAQPGPVGWVYLLCFRDPFQLAWLEYPATRGRERRLKNQGSAYRRCPLCRGTGGPLDPVAAVAAVQGAPLPHPRPAGRR
jgi:hypothetical protein